MGVQFTTFVWGQICLKINGSFVILCTRSVSSYAFEEKPVGSLTVLFTSSGRDASSCRHVVALFYGDFFLWVLLWVFRMKSSLKISSSEIFFFLAEEMDEFKEYGSRRWGSTGTGSLLLVGGVSTCFCPHLFTSLVSTSCSFPLCQCCQLSDHCELF